MYCKNCGVELEHDMTHCPLCGASVTGAAPENKDDAGFGGSQHSTFVHRKMSQPQKKLTWEIVSLVLLSSGIATFIVDFIINNRIVWSEYPVAICLAIFCYMSMFAFSDQTTVIKVTGGLVLSSICIVIIDAVTGSIGWSVRLGIPLLFVSNLVVLVLISIIRRARYKGINLIAYAFLGAAVICISIEGILSFYKAGLISFQWSMIVSASIIPVVIVLLFVHFRLKKGRSLEKTFHV
jgi:hypothetical protein